MNGLSQAELGRLAQQVEADRAENPIRYYRPNTTAIRFHADEHRVRMCGGANRAGKTVIEIAENAMFLTRMNSVWLARRGIDAIGKFKHLYDLGEPLRTRHWCSNLTKVMYPTLLPLYWQFLPARLLDTSRGKRGFNVQTNTLYLVDGSFVQFMSYQHGIDAAESVSMHAVIFDEPPPEKYFDRQLGRVGDVGGFIWGGMTVFDPLVKHPIGWFDRRIRRKGLNKETGRDLVAHFTVPLSDNLHNFSREGQEAMLAWAEMLKTTDPAAYDACVLGLPSMLHGLVYKEFDETVHAQYDKAGADDFAGLARKGYGEIWCGMDHGMRDPTVVLWFYVARKPVLSLDIAEGDVILFKEYHVAGRKPAQHIPVLAKRMHDSKGRLIPVKGILCDPSMWADEVNGPTVAGIYIQGFKAAKVCCRLIRANNNKDVGHELVGELMRVPPEGEVPSWPRFRIVKRACPKTIDELLAYCWTPENDRTGKGGDKTVDVDDHAPDALRYFASARRWKSGQTTQPERAPNHPYTGVPLDLLARPTRLPWEMTHAVG